MLPPHLPLRHAPWLPLAGLAGSRHRVLAFPGYPGAAAPLLPITEDRSR